MELTQPIDPDELGQLAEQWGESRREDYVLQADEPFLTSYDKEETTRRRRGEICYVMHQGDPAEGILLHTKAYYPDHAYRLPTGGINSGDGVLDTLTREIHEETGLRVGEDPGFVQIERYLGVAGYQIYHQREKEAYEFATYHFLVRKPEESAIAPQDLTEQVTGWRWTPLAQFPAIAKALEGVGLSEPKWPDWGRFRAISHRFVYNVLIGTL
ncbi:NUDIX domain-containing protein [Chloroflexi bacterium TSY]|nr:NUDIX domain-containing protein [Chloroflexi bacterium TSY]